MDTDVFICMYADDLKLAVAVRSLADTKKLQSAINELEKCSNNNELHLNLDKCKISLISRNCYSNIIRRDYFYGIFFYISEMLVLLSISE